MEEASGERISNLWKEAVYVITDEKEFQRS